MFQSLNHENIQEQKKLNESPAVKLLMDFMEFHGMKQTMAVFKAESSLKTSIDAQKLANELKIERISSESLLESLCATKRSDVIPTSSATETQKPSKERDLFDINCEKAKVPILRSESDLARSAIAEL